VSAFYRPVLVQFEGGPVVVNRQVDSSLWLGKEKRMMIGTSKKSKQVSPGVGWAALWLFGTAGILLAKRLCRSGIEVHVSVSRTSAILKTGGLIASGVGKGASRIPTLLAIDAIERGVPFTALDAKGDARLLAAIARGAEKQSARSRLVWSPRPSFVPW
jgi:hypothetical protein